MLFRSMGTSKQTELARYDLAIYLESAGRHAYEENRRHNQIRTETWDEAAALDAATRAQWQAHSNLVIVHNNTSFGAKIAAVLAAVEAQMEGFKAL